MANRIRSVRKAKALTLEEMAEETGISTSYLSRIESGGRGLSLESVIKIARFLRVEPEELTDEFDAAELEAAAVVALRDWLIGQGYLEQLETDEETEAITND